MGWNKHNCFFWSYNQIISHTFIGLIHYNSYHFSIDIKKWCAQQAASAAEQAATDAAQVATDAAQTVDSTAGAVVNQATEAVKEATSK